MRSACTAGGNIAIVITPAEVANPTNSAQLGKGANTTRPTTAVKTMPTIGVPLPFRYPKMPGM